MLLTLTSAVLLILSFPNFSLAWLAWFAFVPIFFLTTRIERARAAFTFFYLFGLLFLLASVEWIRHVTYFGWLFGAFLYAFYFGFFGWITHWLLARGRFLLSLVLVPSAWVALEWVRTENAHQVIFKSEIKF